MPLEDTLRQMMLQGLKTLPKSAEVQAEFVRTAATLCEMLRQQGVALDHEHTQGLVIKLGNHCAKRQWNVSALSSGLALITDAIGANPDALADPSLTLRKMLDLHIAHNHEAAAALRRAMLANPSLDTPALEMARSADGAYRLVECRTQRHLQQETAALGHCVGGTHLDHYRDKIARGSVRIFSLRTSAGTPVATVEYETKSKTITQIEGKPRKISGKEPFFPALCHTLHALTQVLPVGAISGLPRLERKLLTRHGVFVSSNSIADTPASDLLAGTVIVDNTMPPSLLHDLCSSPCLILDVTRLDLSRLPPHVKCNLRSDADTFDAPLLQTSGGIVANSAQSFSVPLLQTSGNIYANSASSLSAPLLQTSGNIHADSATSLSVPLLQTSGGIVAPSATSFSVPMLQTAGNIDVDSATSLSVPLLQTAGNIHTNSATSLSAPLLQTAGNIHANSATILSVPLLQNSESIHVPSATSFSAPLLQTSTHICANSATSFSVPVLQTSGIIFANSARIFSAPVLQNSESIHADSATSFNAPLLQTSGVISSQSETRRMR